MNLIRKAALIVGLACLSSGALAQPPSAQTARVAPARDESSRVRVRTSPLDIVDALLGSVRIDVNVTPPPPPPTPTVVVVQPAPVAVATIPEPQTVVIETAQPVLTVTAPTVTAEIPLHVRYANWHPGPPPYDGPPPYPYVELWTNSEVAHRAVTAPTVTAEIPLHVRYANWHPGPPPYDGPPPYPYVDFWPNYANWHPGPPPYDGPPPYPYADLWIAPPHPAPVQVAASLPTATAFSLTAARTQSTQVTEVPTPASNGPGELVVVEESEIATVPPTEEPSSFSYTWGVRALGSVRNIGEGDTNRSEIGFEGGGGLFFGIPLTSWLELRASGDIVAGGDSEDENKATSAIGLSGRMRFRLDDVAPMYIEAGAGFEWVDNGPTNHEGGYGIAGAGVRIPFNCQTDSVMEFGLEGHIGFGDDAEHNALFAVASVEFAGGKQHFDATRSWCRNSSVENEIGTEVRVESTPMEVHVQPAPVQVRVEHAPVHVRVEPAQVQVRAQPAPIQVRPRAQTPVQVRAPQTASVTPVSAPPRRHATTAPTVQVEVTIPQVQVR